MYDSEFNANSILPIHQSIHNAFDDQYSHDNDHNLLNPFHSHLLDDDDLFLQGTMLPYNPSPPQLQPAPLPPAATNKELTGEKIGEKKAVRKGGGSKSRKTGKKDRHSKIHTAQGPRDRRMRLSLQIARKFFDLQDLLGFDKASKTIEWLFNKSKAAIKDLADKRSFNSLISSSPTENIMEIDDANDEDNECEKMKKKEGKNNKRIICEKRKEARARARERTQEKLKMQKQEKRKTLIMNKEGLEIMDNENPSTSVEKERALEDQMASVGIIEKFLAGSSLMANFGDDYDDAFSMGFPENSFQEIGRINSDYEILSNNMEIVNSDYTYQAQEGPNCSFMGRTFNQGY